jgi:hypothetical protein
MQVVCFIALCQILFVLTGCEAEPGRVRAKREQVVGIYETNFDKGRERLELKGDGTYVQEFLSPQRTIQHTGKWEIEDAFLGGSDVNLVDAFVSENDTEGAPQRIGFRTMNAHKRSGKIALALNEVADWYFDRVQ